MKKVTQITEQNLYVVTYSSGDKYYICADSKQSILDETKKRSAQEIENIISIERLSNKCLIFKYSFD